MDKAINGIIRTGNIPIITYIVIAIIADEKPSLSPLENPIDRGLSASTGHVRIALIIVNPTVIK